MKWESLNYFRRFCLRQPCYGNSRYGNWVYWAWVYWACTANDPESKTNQGVPFIHGKILPLKRECSEGGGLQGMGSYGVCLVSGEFIGKLTSYRFVLYGPHGPHGCMECVWCSARSVCKACNACSARNAFEACNAHHVCIRRLKVCPRMCALAGVSFSTLSLGDMIN